MEWKYWIIGTIFIIIIGFLIYKFRVKDEPSVQEFENFSPLKVNDPAVIDPPSNDDSSDNEGQYERIVKNEKKRKNKPMFFSRAIGSIDYKKAIYTPIIAPLGLGVKSLTTNIYSSNPKVCSEKIAGI